MNKFYLRELLVYNYLPVKIRLYLELMVQKSFLPEKAPVVDGYAFSFTYRSAMEVGGDLFDFIEIPDGRIGVAICYDRHYPEYMRALALGGADVVFVPQAGAVGEWPAGLHEAELRVAAFQNGYYAALCNRVGAEELLEFAGESFVCDPQGNVIAEAGAGTEEILFADLDMGVLDGSAGRRLFMRDRRPELYHGWLGKD